MSSSSSSASSTPVDEKTYVPFQPAYSVIVSEPVKNGDIVRYTIKTRKLSDDTEFTVMRQYDDFEYLHHCLYMQNPQDGIIVSSLSSSSLLAVVIVVIIVSCYCRHCQFFIVIAEVCCHCHCFDLPA